MFNTIFSKSFLLLKMLFRIKSLDFYQQTFRDQSQKFLIASITRRSGTKSTKEISNHVSILLNYKKMKIVYGKLRVCYQTKNMVRRPVYKKCEYFLFTKKRY